MFNNSKHARACIFVAFCSAMGTLNAATNVSVSSADAPVPLAGYHSTFSTYKPLTENVGTPDKSWRAANDAVAAAPMGGMQMGEGAMSMPMSKSMAIPAEKIPARKNTRPELMKMPMKKGMSMGDMPMPMGEKMPPMDMHKGVGK